MKATEKAVTVFPIDHSLNQPIYVYINGPTLEELAKPAPKPKPKPNKSTVRNVQSTSGWNSSFSPCSCVSYSKFRTGYSESVGNARNWPKNSQVPTVGGVVVTNESRPGHVGYIIAVREGSFDIIEANYSRCKVTTRTISINNPLILGFWTPN